MRIWWDAILTLLRTEEYYLVTRKLSLLLLTLEIALKELVIVRIFKKQILSQRILGYNWLVGNYSIFFANFYRHFYQKSILFFSN